MKNVADRLLKLEKKISLLTDFIANSGRESYLVSQLMLKIAEVDKVPEPMIKLRKCPSCKHWWFSRDRFGCSKFPERYTYPTSKLNEVESRKITCEGFQLRGQSRMLRPFK